MNFISFAVIVPVLSEKMTEILPSSSGIVLFLATAPNSGSEEISLEKNNFEKSRFSLRDIGMIVERSKTYLKTFTTKFSNLPDPTKSTKEMPNMIKNNCLEILFNS